MAEDDEWITLGGVPSIADLRFLDEYRQNGPGQTLWEFKNLADVSDEDPEPPTLGGLGLLYPSKRHVFSGPQETAKTVAAYILALEIMRAGGRVVLIDFEMGERDAKRRFVELGATDVQFALLDYVEPESPMTDAVSETIVERKPQLVLVDASAGAYDLQELDDNNRGDVERFSSTFMRPFWKAKIATLIIDHVVKNVESRGNYAIGSERKVGGVDVHLGFTVVHPIKRGSKGVYKITTHKDRPGFHKRGKLADMELESDPETHAISWQFKAATETDQEHPFRPTHLMEKVSIFLERQTDAVSVRTVKAAKLGKDEYVREALKVLVDEGFVKVIEGQNRSLLHECVMAYREANDTLSQVVPEVMPSGARTPEDASDAVSPSPYGGDAPAAPTEKDSLGDAQRSLDDYDDIPF